ncbi:MAG: hypothetical protein V1861_00160 [Candidatus Micrarchaeota archaeon]
MEYNEIKEKKVCERSHVMIKVELVGVRVQQIYLIVLVVVDPGLY